jgi:hypothetical protein
MKHLSLVTVRILTYAFCYMLKLIVAQLIFQNSALILVRPSSNANNSSSAIEAHSERGDTVHMQTESVGD